MYVKKIFTLSLSLIISLFIFFTIPLVSLASTTSGTIDSTNRYAWTENAGWLDFGGSYSSVSVTDSALSGYAFGENIGWVSLNCSNDNSCATVDYKVINDGSGTLSGYAYGENAGWVKFDPQNGGVSINSSGEFMGYAYGENIGWIVFNCFTTGTCGTIDYKVSTDYRPSNSRPACNNGLDDDSDDKTDYPTDPGCASADDTSEADSIRHSSSGGYSRVVQPQQLQTSSVNDIFSSVVSVFKPKPKVELPTEPLPEETISKTTPLALSNKLGLISISTVGRFVLAPLPDEIMFLTEKFPELGKTFSKLGITKIGDLHKLKIAKFVLHGLGQKQSFPSEIVFAKNGSLIDYSIHLTIDDTGSPEQIINTIVGKTLDLVVRVDKPTKNVKGYLVVKKIDRQVGRTNVPVTSLLATPIMAILGASLPATGNVQIEQKMVLSEFAYEDKNNDGIYTADIQMPLVHGEYEIISIIEYKNTSYGKKELRLTAVIDPEGYVYEKNGNKETRIPYAKVSLFWKNSKINNFELWPAKDFQQVNPQKTDKSGTYSFLVQEGTYKLTISAPGYDDFMGQEFDVNEGSGVHENIPLKSKNWLRRLFGNWF